MSFPASPVHPKFQQNSKSRLSNTRFLFLVFCFLSIVLFFFLTACNRVAPTLKIGLVAPFEGQQREIGYDTIYSARLAVREINEAGGINGYRIVLVAFDDRGEATLAADVAEALVIDPDVVAVIGHWQVETAAAAQPIYGIEALAFIAMGSDPWGTFEGDDSVEFAQFEANYQAITPFDESAGIYAAPTYDAFQLLFAAIDKVTSEEKGITRQALMEALADTTLHGLSGDK